MHFCKLSWHAKCMCDNNADLLQAERGHSQGDASSKLGEKHVEGVEDGFMAFRVGVGQSEVIHHIWQHRPELHTHTCRVESPNFFFAGCCEHVSSMFNITHDIAKF